MNACTPTSCSPDTYCNSQTGACSPIQSCNVTSDCGPNSGLVCVANQCVSPQCTTNANCPPGNSCVNYSCVPASGNTCDANTPCQSGFICNNGKCVQAQCLTNSDCPPGQICTSGNTCTPSVPVCNTFNDCKPGEYCVNGYCTANPCSSITSCSGIRDSESNIGTNCGWCFDGRGSALPENTAGTGPLYDKCTAWISDSNYCSDATPCSTITSCSGISGTYCGWCKDLNVALYGSSDGPEYPPLAGGCVGANWNWESDDC
jgi:hypothetical protein